ncbi:fasciclin domain-containing protein [Pseudooctadecabacter jejudonensis]|uniref:Immunogenic protein MPT70 n=1 Tax=Pseudooctadecabacter jejudonensis TaxID=1391910 RepID=A0A1Y5RDA2_9RHOB|nr:fasciclin domain-containing protein [Pseudooctadecabacter jejudonensis]SLN14742.1 Immunogenic protein MPT70 precursor [Pseudooctadecabacter jejudonensis]
MKTTIKAALLSASVLGLAAAAANAEEDGILNGELLDENATIVENAAKVQNFSTLVAAVEAAGLADDLMGEGPFTIFAPTDAAFAALPEGTVENLLLPENQDQLINILSAHVIPGEYTRGDMEVALLQDEVLAEDFELMKDENMLSFDTLALTDILVERVGGSFYINNDIGVDENIEVINGDIMTSNGVIHVIDQVILPSS